MEGQANAMDEGEVQMNAAERRLAPKPIKNMQSTLTSVSVAPLRRCVGPRARGLCRWVACTRGGLGLGLGLELGRGSGSGVGVAARAGGAPPPRPCAT